MSESSISVDDGGSQPIQATVYDQDHAAMSASDVTVQWSVTDPNIARVQGGVISGLSPGQTSVSASASSTASASVTVTVRQVATKIEDLGNGSVRDAFVGDTVPQLLVRVLDRHGIVVPNATVTFAVTAGGGTLTSQSSTTGADGVARTSWIFGPSPGDQHVEVRTSSFPSVPAITISGIARRRPSQLAITGAPTTPTSAGATLASIVIEVRDATGALVPSASAITLALAQSPTGASIAGTLTRQAVAGVATFNDIVLTRAGSYQLRATSTGLTDATTSVLTVGPSAAARAEVAAGDGQTQQIGHAVATPPAVRVLDSYGNPVPGVSVSFAVTSGGGQLTGATAVTSTAGVATVGSWVLGAQEGSNTVAATVSADGVAGSPVTFTAMATSSSPPALTRNSADPQTAAVHAAVPAPPSVRVSRDGQPLGGVTLTFAVTAGGGTVAGAATQQVVTGVDGIATAGAWVLGSTPGANTLEARAEGVSGSPMVFSATAVAGTAAAVAKVDGDGQRAQPGSTVAKAPAVKVSDASGNPVPNAEVKWAVTAGGGSILGSATVLTGSDGISRVSGWKLGAAPGANALQATVTGTGITGNPATFSATATLAGVVIVSGEGQRAAAGYTVPDSLRVRVRDDAGNPRAGVNVQWVTRAGGGGFTVGERPDTASSVTLPTDANGESAVAWALGPNDSAQVVAAMVGSDSTRFTATSHLLKPASVEFFDGDGNQISSKSIDFLADSTLSVRILDAADSLVFGVGVELSVSTDVATIAPVSGGGKGVKTGGSIRIHGQAQGSGKIVAAGGATTNFDLTINSPIARSVTIVGDDGQPLGSPTLALGDSIHVRCLAFDKNHREIPTSWPAQNNGTDFLRCQWSLDNRGVSDLPEAWIKPTSTGSPELTVTVDQVHALVTIEVTQTVTSITVAPLYPPEVGIQNVLQATGRDKYGNVVETEASWSTDRPNDLTIAYDDVAAATVNPRIAGTFTVHATMQNVSTTYQLVVPPLVFTSYSAGAQMSCAIANSGRTYCWGYGFGFDPLSTTFEQRSYPVPVAVEHAFTQIAVGYAHVCGRESTGHVFCWGQSAAAGSPDYLPEPIEVSGNHIFSSIAAGLFHTCGISSGQLYCWGDNTSGQLGNPAAGSSSSVPVLVSGGLSWSQVTLGQFHTCGIAGGKAYCWGSNGEGQIGIGTVTFTNQPTPIEVASDPTGWTQISSVNRHTCGIAGGRVYCWGEGSDGQIGDGGYSIRSTPTAISSSQSFSQISAGTSHSCALTTGGQAYCWGDNSSGEYGNGGTTSSTVPVPAATGLTWSSLRASSLYNCGVTTAGLMYCWGFDQRGVLGIDTPAGIIDGDNYVSPMKVASQP